MAFLASGPSWAEEEGSCKDRWRKLALDSPPGNFQPIKLAMRHGMKITLFPYYLPAKVIKLSAKEEIRKIPYRILSEDGVAAFGWLTLFVSDSSPAQVILGDVIGAHHDELDDEDYFSDPGGHSVVGLNGVQSSERFHKAADYMTGAARADGKKVVQMKVDSPDDIIAKLEEEYRKNGPIGKLVLAGHGSPGAIRIGGVKLDKKWAEANAEKLRQLPRDLFAKDAKVILVSCSTAFSGMKDPGQGPESLKAIFSPLLKQGGTIVASTRYVKPELTHIPKEYRDQQLVGDVFLPPILAAAEALALLNADPVTRTTKVRHIPVAPAPAAE